MSLLSPFKRKSAGKETGTKKRRTTAASLLHSSMTSSCLTIAAQYGSSGEGIGSVLAGRLGFRLQDSEILDMLAHQSRVSRETLAALDEDSDVGVSFLMSSLLGSPYVVAEDFARDLARALHQIAEAGQTVIVGRGAAFAVQGSGVLNVRVIEPFEKRLKKLQDTQELSYTEAEIYIAERDSSRAQFVEDYFRRDIDDPEAYDLIINTAHLSSSDVVDLILTAFKAKTSNQ